MLFQDRNVGVDYEYSLPTNIQPGYETETYAWTFDQFTTCSATCGGGTNTHTSIFLSVPLHTTSSRYPTPKRNLRRSQDPRARRR